MTVPIDDRSEGDPAGETPQPEATTATRGDDGPVRSSSASGSLPGFSLARTIGLGGMGEVVLAHDETIGRDVAVKRLRSANPSPNAIARFLREARIPQARP